MPPPLNRGRQWLPAQFRHQFSVARTTPQWLGPHVTEGHKAQRRIPGVGRRCPSSQGKQGQPRSCHGASGTLFEDVGLWANIPKCWRERQLSGHDHGTKPTADTGAVPRRGTSLTYSENKQYRKVNRHRADPSDSRYRAWHRASRSDTGHFFRKRANRNLYQSRQAQSCLKVVQRATRGDRVPSALCRQPAN